ncbi:MAG: hypothetical protein JRH20_22835 [Deltaproteobacteria bacterium]|nr:hypothetical protein [Deltaproteobacteria bacterium]
MSTDTYEFEILATHTDTLRLQVTLLEEGGSVDFSPSLLLRGLADVFEPAALDGLDAEHTVRKLVRTHIRSLELIEEAPPTAVFDVGLDPDWVSQLSPTAWTSTAYASDFPSAVDAVSNAKENKLLIAWSAWPGGPGYAALHTLSKHSLGARKAILNHPGLVGLAADPKAWWTAGGSFVQQWSTTGKPKKRFELDSAIKALVMGAQGPVVGLSDGRICSLDGTVQHQADSSIRCLASHGEHLVAGTEAGVVWTPNGEVSLGEGPVEEIAILADGHWAAVHQGALHKGHGGTQSDTELDVDMRSLSTWSASTWKTQVSLLQERSVCVLNVVDPQPRYLELPVKPVETGLRGDVVWAGSRRRLLVWRDGKLVVDAEADFLLGMSPNVKPAISPDGRWLVACRADAPMALWDLHTGRCTDLRVPAPEEEDKAEAADLGWLDAETFIVGTNYFQVYIFKTDGSAPTPGPSTAKNLQTLPASEVLVLKNEGDLSFMAAGEVVTAFQTDDYATPMAASTSGVVFTSDNEEGQLWRDGAVVTTLTRASLAALSPSGEWLALLGSDFTGIQLIHTTTGKVASIQEVQASFVVVTDQGRVYAGAEGTILSFGPGEQDCVWKPEEQQVTFRYRSVTAGPDGFVAGSDRPGHPRCVALPSGRRVQLGQRFRVN